MDVFILTNSNNTLYFFERQVFPLKIGKNIKSEENFFVVLTAADKDGNNLRSK